MLATRPEALGPREWSALRAAFAPPELVEIVAFCAWQYGGPRMLRSWRSEDYKRGERPDLATLPVCLAYAARQGETPRWPPREQPPPEAVLARAERLGAPPLAWARLLATRPDVLADWTGLYWTTVHGELLGPRLGQLVRLAMSQLLACPEWAPLDSAAVRQAGLGPAHLAALARGDTAWLTPKERAALAYVREVVADTDVPDAVFAEVAAALSEAEIVALGFAVAVQNGAIRVFRSLQQPGVRAWLDQATASPVP
ncbi:MAG TPA: carboxymuconolactone decarboxylase family protein [Chloroflexota bacterium]|nr:carboxymuconolactone decarboxylase family protein [Chloroflexota bacterium]